MHITKEVLSRVVWKMTFFSEEVNVCEKKLEGCTEEGERKVRGDEERVNNFFWASCGCGDGKKIAKAPVTGESAEMFAGGGKVSVRKRGDGMEGGRLGKVGRGERRRIRGRGGRWK